MLKQPKEKLTSISLLWTGNLFLLGLDFQHKNDQQVRPQGKRSWNLSYYNPQKEQTVGLC